MMNINNLWKVNDLSEKLKKALHRHRELRKLRGFEAWLTPYKEYADITLGSDKNGGDSTFDYRIRIADSPDLVARTDKLIDDAWGKVVTIRCELRLLGVVLESRK